MLERASFTELITSFANRKNYPCVAAIHSINKNEYDVGHFGELGVGSESLRLARELLKFRDEQENTGEQYLSYIAVFEGPDNLSEEEFEKRLWLELSYLTSHEELSSEWDPAFSSDPRDKDFCFSLGGSAFFVVGMHPKSSRKSRQFPYPMLVFNIYQQFRDLRAAGKFEPMVKTIRERDKLFQGDVNPMVEKYDNTWESIQFSGKNNPPDWQCPFQHGLKPSYSSSHPSSSGTLAPHTEAPKSHHQNQPSSKTDLSS
ncbi:guanitoxin biosynthesis heme-dependent pre-guanitoxin N-hydroxylase GntA [Bdellovibrio bacteriovorus]|uniref:guanitoxin biosynthesis heme-dependent pre-guanitoxin N-hydroxylase GntA n=1 Tax=Bdellovibrio bacteriovorus TaxID=959 RepID=UPI0035A6A546